MAANHSFDAMVHGHVRDHLHSGCRSESENIAMSRRALLLWLLLSASPIMTLKVGQRWSGQSKNMTIRVLFPTLKRGTVNEHSHNLLSPSSQDTINLGFRPFKGIRPTEVIGTKIGDRLPNGSFDGMIGALAAGRADMMFQTLDPGVFDVDLGIPGHIGPVAFDGQLAILSAGQPPLEVESSLLSFIVESVEGNLYKYIFIWLFLLMIIHTLFVITCRQEQRTRRLGHGQGLWDDNRTFAQIIAKQFLNSLWLVLEVLLVTESTVKPKIKIRETTSLTIITFSFIICVYYAMDIVLWNHLTAQLSMELPSKFIDHVHELINATTNNGSFIIPIVIHGYGTLNYLKTSSRPVEQELLKYINQFPPNVSIQSFNKLGTTFNIYPLFEKLARGETAMIDRKASFFAVPMLCYHKPELAKKMHVSANSFGGGYNTFFYGPAMNIGSVRDMNFHLTNLAEMGFLYEGFGRQIRGETTLIKSDLVPSVISGLRCEDEVVEKVGRDPRYDPQDALIFDLEVMKEVFLILVQGLILSSFALTMERTSSMLARKRKERRMVLALKTHSMLRRKSL